VLAYDLALVDFEALQEAGPATGTAAGGSQNGSPQQTQTGTTGPPAVPVPAAVRATGIPGSQQ
jgi:hypothetical protein